MTITGGCAWLPIASDSWIGTAVAGNQLSITAAANNAATARTALIHVRGAVIVVTQEANTAPNLVTNGGFDNGTSAWSDAFSGSGSVTIGTNTPIVAPTPSPTAALLTWSGGSPAVYQLSQCVAITGGKTYEAGAKVLIPSGQSPGVINVAVFEYWAAGCSPIGNYHQHPAAVASNPTGVWFDAKLSWNSDFSAKSALVVIGVGGTTAIPPFSAWFDDVFVREKK